MAEYNCCGVLVHGAPDRFAQLQVNLADLPGVEIHGVAEPGRMVVTIEDAGEYLCADTLSDIQKLDGVLSAAVVYQYTDQPS